MTIELTNKKVTVEEVTITCSKGQLTWMRNAAANEHNSQVSNDNGYSSQVWVARCRKIVQMIDETGIVNNGSCVELQGNLDDVDPQWDDNSGVGFLD